MDKLYILKSFYLAVISFAAVNKGCVSSQSAIHLIIDGGILKPLFSFFIIYFHRTGNFKLDYVSWKKGLS